MRVEWRGFCFCKMGMLIAICKDKGGAFGSGHRGGLFRRNNLSLL